MYVVFFKRNAEWGKKQTCHVWGQNNYFFHQSISNTIKVKLSHNERLSRHDTHQMLSNYSLHIVLWYIDRCLFLNKYSNGLNLIIIYWNITF